MAPFVDSYATPAAADRQFLAPAAPSLALGEIGSCEFGICTFWRLDSLAPTCRKQGAREIFEAMLASRNHLGLLSEDTDPVAGEMWSNFPQMYSMAGIINGVVRLSAASDTVI